MRKQPPLATITLILLFIWSILILMAVASCKASITRTTKLELSVKDSCLISSPVRPGTYTKVKCKQ